MNQDCQDCRATVAARVPVPLLLPTGVVRLDEAARAWLGVPFVHQGRTREGLDCIGLLVKAAEGCGLPISDRTDYPRNPSANKLDLCLKEQLRGPLPKSDMRAGDVVSIEFRGAPRHVAIIGEHDGRLTLIHTSFGVGRVVEHSIGSGNWLPRIHAVYRVSHE